MAVYEDEFLDLGFGGLLFSPLLSLKYWEGLNSEVLFLFQEEGREEEVIV